MRLLMHAKRGAAKKSRMGPVTTAFSNVSRFHSLSPAVQNSGALSLAFAFNIIQ